MWIFETVMLILIIIMVAVIIFFRFYFYLDGYGKYILVSTSPCIQNKKYNVYQCEGNAPCLDNYGQTLSYATKLEEVGCSPNDMLNNIVSGEGEVRTNRLRPELIAIGDTKKAYGRHITRDIDKYYLDGQETSLRELATLQPQNKLLFTTNSISVSSATMKSTLIPSYLFTRSCNSELFTSGTINNKKCYKIPNELTLSKIKINGKYLIRRSNSDQKEQYILITQDELNYQLRLLNLNLEQYLKTRSPYLNINDEGIFIFDSKYPGWLTVVEGKIKISLSPSIINNYEVISSLDVTSVYQDDVNIF